MKFSSSTRISFPGLMMLGLMLIGLTNSAPAAQFWKDLYEPQIFDDMPCRIMQPLSFDAKKNIPLLFHFMVEVAEGKTMRNNSKTGIPN